MLTAGGSGLVLTGSTAAAAAPGPRPVAKVSVKAPVKVSVKAPVRGGARTPVQTAATTTDGRRGLWYAIGDTPTAAAVDAAALTYAVVVLNPWETWALRRIKQLAPSVTVLVYKCLSSTRSYHVGPLPPTGVGHAEAEQDPAWFATDTAGRRIEWGPYPGHVQMAVWDDAYQARWTANVVEEVVAAGWDGVLADNDLATLRWYSPAVLSGTASQAETDTLLKLGLDGLVETAGRALNARGKLLVPNISDARLQPGRWRSHAAYGGGMEENFVHWGTDPSTGFLADWTPGGWVDQTAQLDAGLSLAVTRAAAGDTRTLLYGWASTLVRGGPDDLWTPSTTPAGDYTRPESLPEMRLDIGSPTAAAVRQVSGVWTRGFARGWAAVNPTTQAVTVGLPKGAVDADGRRLTSLRLGPTSGAVLRVVR